MPAPDPDALGRRAAERLLSGVEFTHDPAFTVGLTDAEFDAVERRFGFTFADDHRAFLATVLPTGQSWPDWRSGDEQDLRRRLDWPVVGTLFDVERDSFWSDDWGPRPDGTAAAVAVARERLASVPQMVPVFSHRYLPAGRGTAGHPVLSMVQTDIVFYGLDIDDYIHREFDIPDRAYRGPERHPRATVAFWRDFV